jgi:predicted O-methyltransferase YrrM
MKKKLLTFLKKNNKINEFLFIIKKSFLIFKIIKKSSLKYAIFFLPKIIQGVSFVRKNHNAYLEKKIFFDKKYKWNYGDVFSPNIPIWEKIVSKFNAINYLEIGSFEGRSAVFIGELKNTNSIMAVDTFQGSDEYQGMNELLDTNFDKVFENFKINIDLINKKNINYLKDTSDNFFKKNKNTYNLIYIDGSHHYDNVKKDFVNSYEHLEKNGIIIMDDFLWLYYKDFEKNPINAIIQCYQKYKKNLELVFLNHQIIFKKK